MSLEIAALREREDRMQLACETADRLCRSLLDEYACDWVIADNLPYQTWCSLPVGWQMGLSGPVAVMSGRPAREHRGAVGVSLETLKWIARG